MAEVKAQVLNPENINLKFEATFTLGEWQRIEQALDKKWSWPVSELVDAIRDCTAQAEKVFIPNTRRDA